MSGGAGHGPRDSIRPIICRLGRSDGGHILRYEWRVSCRFSTDFRTRPENQTNLF